MNKMKKRNVLASGVIYNSKKKKKLKRQHLVHVYVYVCAFGIDLLSLSARCAFLAISCL